MRVDFLKSGERGAEQKGEFQEKRTMHLQYSGPLSVVRSLLAGPELWRFGQNANFLVEHQTYRNSLLEVYTICASKENCIVYV